MKFNTAESRRKLARVSAWLTADYYMPVLEVQKRLCLSESSARQYVNEARVRINEHKRMNPTAPPERRREQRGPATYAVPIFLSL